MGQRSGLVLRKLLSERKIQRSRITVQMVANELAAAVTDLRTAQRSLRENDSKWATVQAYYCMFHAARALLYQRGFREYGHRGLLAAVRVLYSTELSGHLLDDFSDAMKLREAADYGLIYSEESAKDVVDAAKKFLAKLRKILKKSHFGLARATGPFTKQNELKPNDEP